MQVSKQVLVAYFMLLSVIAVNIYLLFVTPIRLLSSVIFENS